MSGSPSEARTHWANFCLFCEKSCHQFLKTSAPGDFLIYQILSSLAKLQRRRRPASEQDKFLLGVKSDRFVNLHGHDLKENINQENLDLAF